MTKKSKRTTHRKVNVQTEPHDVETGGRRKETVAAVAPTAATPQALPETPSCLYNPFAIWLAWFICREDQENETLMIHVKYERQIRHTFIVYGIVVFVFLILFRDQILLFLPPLCMEAVIYALLVRPKRVDYVAMLISLWFHIIYLLASIDLVWLPLVFIVSFFPCVGVLLLCVGSRFILPALLWVIGRSSNTSSVNWVRFVVFPTLLFGIFAMWTLFSTLFYLIRAHASIVHCLRLLVVFWCFFLLTK
jgi:hypothetical protein